MSNEVIKIYGTRWCGDCYRAKFLLKRKNIPYRWIDIDKDESARNLVLEINQGKTIVPTIILHDGSILIEPSTNELIEKLGFDT
jgi:glutaredoxin-like protein